MANATNKHKAQGKKAAPVKKESWWTPQRVKYAIAAAVAAIIIIIAIACFNYVSGLQDSVVGTWSNKFEASDNGDAMEVLFTFNEDMSCGFTRTRAGVEEAAMDGYYDIDDNYDMITVMLGENMETVIQYYYDCDDGELSLKNFTSGIIDEYTKVTE